MSRAWKLFVKFREIERRCEGWANSAAILSPERVTESLRGPGELLFEGAQGVLLDEDVGIHPHTTWSRTTCANARQILREAGIAQTPRRIGVLRSYFTRHGVGPLVTEDDRLRPVLAEPHNSGQGFQGKFRVGVFDAVAASYAAEAGGVDELAITHLDLLPLLPDHVCTEYRSEENAPFKLQRVLPSDFDRRAQVTRALGRCRAVFTRIPVQSSEGFVALLQNELKLPVRLMSFGPRATDKLVCLP